MSQKKSKRYNRMIKRKRRKIAKEIIDDIYNMSFSERFKISFAIITKAGIK